MPRLVVLAHQEARPRGAEFEASADDVLCDALLEHGVAIEHACGKSGACANRDLIVELPRHIVNFASEHEVNQDACTRQIRPNRYQ